MKKKKGSTATACKPRKEYISPVWIDRLCTLILFCGLLLAAYHCFFRLGQGQVLNWDESRHGVSAYEMLQNDNYLVNTYRYEPDYWNLKPPMSFWGVVLGFKIFGTTILGMRFYSAAAFFLTILLATVFAWKRYSKKQAAFVSLLLGCCAPFYYIHFARSGDADALFTLFMTICMLAAVLLREKPELSWICGLSFSCAFLTKSWHVLMILGAAGVYFLWAKLYRVLKLRHWIMLISSAILPMLIWAILRYRFDGLTFLGQMVEYDLFARTTQTLEGHNGGALFYPKLILEATALGFFAVYLAVYLGFNKITEASKIYVEKESKLRKDIPVYLIWFFAPLLQFTIAKTKLAWYIYPALVGLIILCGLLMGSIVEKASVYRWDAAVTAFLLIIVLGIDLAKFEVQRQEFLADGVQIFVSEQLAGQPQLMGEKVYLEVEPDMRLDGTNQTLTSWPQRYVFLGEAYLDANCVDGGAKKFMEDSGLLIISRQKYENDEQLKGLKLFEQSEDYVCVIRE